MNYQSPSTQIFSPQLNGERVVVAMSGGVDSALAAVLLKERGWDVVGVSMQVWDYRRNQGNAKKATCCAPADFDDARIVAERFGIPFYVFDFEDSFHDAVIQPFVDSYFAGRTPNPCLDCNRKVKFRELRQRAKHLHSRYVATGHYAQIKRKNSGQLGLFTSVDRAKDQSYFLYGLQAAELGDTLFPVGNFEKPEVRAELRRRDLVVAEKAESQDICFVSSSLKSFLERQSGRSSQVGAVIDKNGRKLAEHDGAYQFTVGQRKGLGIGGGDPLYVLQVDCQKNEVMVGGRDDLRRESFMVRDCNWLARSAESGKFTSLVKMRYRHAGVYCTVEPMSTDQAKVTFASDWSAVSPGQAAVFYANELDSSGDREVIGGGIIVGATDNVG